MFSDKNEHERFAAGRRRFLGGLAAFGALAFQPAAANYIQPLSDCRELSLKNLHTGESLQTVYWENGEYQSDALAALNHVLRDHRSNESTDLDVNLLDMLSDLQQRTGNKDPWEVISAFRSESTNEKLRKSSNGVARKSFHCLGRALDVRQPGTSLKDLHKAVAKGVGNRILYLGSKTGKDGIHKVAIEGS